MATFKPDLSKLSLGDKVMGGTGVALLIDLTFLPWHDIDLGPFGSVSRSALESPNGFWGVLALLVTLAVLAALAVTRFTDAKLPDLPVALPQALLIGSAVVAGLLVLKLLMETEALAFGAFLGILLAAGMTYGAFLNQHAKAGVRPATPGATA